jgi:hypothetical protein
MITNPAPKKTKKPTAKNNLKKTTNPTVTINKNKSFSYNGL